MSFDLTVDKRDPKNGRIVSSDPYIRYSSLDGVVYLRSGVYYTESGQIAPDDLVKRIVGKEAKLAEAKAETTGNTLKK
jgi:hypothetical protein